MATPMEVVEYELYGNPQKETTVIPSFIMPKIEAVDRTRRGTAVDGFPIEPYEDVVFIEQQENEKSAGGIILAGESRKLPAGVVVAVGPGRWFHPPMDASGFNSGAVFVPTRTKLGDFVVFGRYQSGGEPLEISGKKYLLCREGDLAGRSHDGSAVEVRIAMD